MSLGTLYIVCAPSGAGKTSLVSALLLALPQLEVSISYTTRGMRPGEANDVNYHFVSEAKFKELIEQNIFLEHAVVFGNYYGTSRVWVEQKLQQGIDVILEIDWQGAQQIKKLFPASIGIFILPPSIDILRSRLIARGQDDAATIKKRLGLARDEISHYKEFEYLVINDNFDVAIQELKSIIIARRLLVAKQQEKHHSLISQLLG